jgi:hypothetical protein
VERAARLPAIADAFSAWWREEAGAPEDADATVTFPMHGWRVVARSRPA